MSITSPHASDTFTDIEENGVRLRLTVVDTPGFGDYVNNRDSWTPIIDFIDDQHEAYMRQEQQPQRKDKIDLRVHACLYFIRPTGHTSVTVNITSVVIYSSLSTGSSPLISRP